MSGLWPLPYRRRAALHVRQPFFALVTKVDNHYGVEGRHQVGKTTHSVLHMEHNEVKSFRFKKKEKKVIPRVWSCK